MKLSEGKCGGIFTGLIGPDKVSKAVESLRKIGNYLDSSLPSYLFITNNK